jgi:hypothetical protein
MEAATLGVEPEDIKGLLLLEGLPTLLSSSCKTVTRISRVPTPTATCRENSGKS